MLEAPSPASKEPALLQVFGRIELLTLRVSPLDRLETVSRPLSVIMEVQEHAVTQSGGGQPPYHTRIIFRIFFHKLESLL